MYDIKWIRENRDIFDAGRKRRGLEPLAEQLLILDDARRAAIAELQKAVDTLIVIPNQNLFRVANEKTTFADAFAMADQVLYSGVASVTDLMVKEGLINLDFADVRSIMRGMGKAMMGTGEASGEKRANRAAEAAIANPLLDDVSMKGARGLLISITGGDDLTLYEVDEAASRIRQEVDEDANIILGATFDSSLEGVVRVSVVATGIDLATITVEDPTSATRMAEAAERMRQNLASQRITPPIVTTPQVAPQNMQPYQPELRETSEMAKHSEPPVAPAYQAPTQAAAHGVYLEPAPVRQTYVAPSAVAETPAPPEVSVASYVPPVAEAPRMPRMPQVEDFPKDKRRCWRRLGDFVHKYGMIHNSSYPQTVEMLEFVPFLFLQ